MKLNELSYKFTMKRKAKQAYILRINIKTESIHALNLETISITALTHCSQAFLNKTILQIRFLFIAPIPAGHEYFMNQFCLRNNNAREKKKKEETSSHRHFTWNKPPVSDRSVKSFYQYEDLYVPAGVSILGVNGLILQRKKEGIVGWKGVGGGSHTYIKVWRAVIAHPKSL